MVVGLAKEHRIIFKTIYFVTKNRGVRAMFWGMAMGFI